MTDIEQFRPGFEAWFLGDMGFEDDGKTRDWIFKRYAGGGKYLNSDVELRWEGYAAAKREASTEPSAVYGPVHVVGDLVRNLLTLDQSMPIHAAFHVDFDGARRCRTRPVIVSRERVIDGKWVDGTRKDVPYAAIVWGKPQTDEAGGAQKDEAKDAARLSETMDHDQLAKLGRQLGK